MRAQLCLRHRPLTICYEKLIGFDLIDQNIVSLRVCPHTTLLEFSQTAMQRMCMQVALACAANSLIRMCGSSRVDTAEVESHEPRGSRCGQWAFNPWRGDRYPCGLPIVLQRRGAVVLAGLIRLEIGGSNPPAATIQEAVALHSKCDSANRPQRLGGTGTRHRSFYVSLTQWSECLPV
jgi:hypothetical protein